MDVSNLENIVNKYCIESPDNRFSDFRIFDEPIFAYGSSNDDLYRVFRDNPDANLNYLMLPKEWLPSAKTIISIFLPFSERIRESNRVSGIASIEWAIGRFEGQQFISKLAEYLNKTIKECGFEAVVPCIDKRFKAIEIPGENDKFPKGTGYTSNWSERHNAFICGMGTFGLSKGIITNKGMAGRFLSIITDAEFPVTKRDYTGLYDRCIKCYSCVRKCPANAIDKTEGKKHLPCAKVLRQSEIDLKPRYGCGKCQVGVPCEFCNPSSK